MVIYINEINIWLVYMRKVKLPFRKLQASSLFSLPSLFNHQDVLRNDDYARVASHSTNMPKMSQNRSLSLATDKQGGILGGLNVMYVSLVKVEFGKINCARDIPFGLCFISVRIRSPHISFRAIPLCKITSGLSRDQIWARS